jgi:hypothetical protein
VKICGVAVVILSSVSGVFHVCQGISVGFDSGGGRGYLRRVHEVGHVGGISARAARGDARVGTLVLDGVG